VNDSPSTTSRDWPTRWPSNSFRNLWTILVVIVVASPFVATLILAEKYASRIPSPQTMSQYDVIFSLALTALVEAPIALMIFLVLPSLSKFSLTELGYRRPTASTVGIGLLGGVVMVIVTNGLASLIATLANSKHQQSDITMFGALHDPKLIAIFAFFALIFAPFVEETIFRVFFFNLGLRYGGFWTGAILSGALFGIAHGDVYAAIPLGAGGIVLCYVYYTTRNAYASMISHSFFNTLSLAALLFVPQWAR
jgi:uncharacterized protein